MRLSRLRPVSLAIVMSALLGAACNKASSNSDDAGAPTANSAAAVDKPKRKIRSRHPEIPAPPDDRFDAKIAANLAQVPDPQIKDSDPATTPPPDNTLFRDRVVAFVREVASGQPTVTCTLPARSDPAAHLVVWIYQNGEQIGRGEATNTQLCVALKDATRQAVAATGAKPEALANTRFVVDLPDYTYTMVEFEGKGLELTHGLVPVRRLDKALLQRHIDEGKAYLLRVMDPERKGVHKYYHAVTDTMEPELHTIYTASTALTLLKLVASTGDKGLLNTITGAADFMLSMQSQDDRDHTRGAFFYAYDLKRHKPQRKLVVGTASKSIFTLLELYAINKDKKYLDAATQAADWLVAMQKPDGSVRSSLSAKEARWVIQQKESLLYTGQTLSALSRISKVTQDPKYKHTAAMTANYLASKVDSRGCYLGDDYRKPNPISSSWVILSLLDYVKATSDPRMENIVFRCAHQLIGRQWRKDNDIYRYGRYRSSLSSSGNGWLAEVMSEVYLYCRDKGQSNCDRFKEAVIASIRLLLQYTVSPENAFVIKNPKAAVGGVYWSVTDRDVRTDSVCHAMNAYLNIIGQLGDETLVEIAEPPLETRLKLQTKAADGDPKELTEEEREDAEESRMSRSEDPAEESGQKNPLMSMP